MAEKINAITGKIQTRSINTRISENLYNAFKIFLYDTHQIGKGSEIIRDLLYNYIKAEKGIKYMINPLWEKEENEREREEELKASLKLTDSFEEELARLKEDCKPTKKDIAKPKSKNDITTHPKYPIFIKVNGTETWTCRICEKDGLGNRGLHKHPCIIKFNSQKKDIIDEKELRTVKEQFKPLIDVLAKVNKKEAQK